ncbi:MAG TPA: hypothetical protein VF601_16995 [Beijerinckiaceae bacterium]|jgi:hypothetical protein
MGGSASLKAQTAPKVTDAGTAPPASVIYIGNSFFYFHNGINGHVAQLNTALTPGQALRSTMVTISGSGFDWHDVESYFRPNAIGRYSFNADNSVSFNRIDRLFDVAVMMDCSQCPVHPDLKGIFVEYAKRHADTVRRHGARPVFFMSWAYQDKPEMTQQLAEAYTRAGNDNDAMVIPAGLAFARVVKDHPEINLYMPDKRHPSLAGSYLSAATTYAALFNKSPVGAAYTAGLEPSVARVLQEAAWETVREYLRRS